MMNADKPRSLREELAEVFASHSDDSHKECVVVMQAINDMITVKR